MITVENLSCRYGDYLAVDNVNFIAQSGKVTGFLGPNGAGKSTTMRIMVGLTSATSGRVTFNGISYKDLPNPGRSVGVLLDASAQHGGRTGRETLTLGAMVMGLPKTRVDEVLNLVSLSESEARRTVKNYSLGMRQRLGIAHALLGNPETLILDEPANGLDPAGIRWMRELLRDHALKGGAVVLSSHLLNEVEMVADELVLIGRGRIVAQGNKQTLLQGSGTYIEAVDNQLLLAALSRNGLQPVAVGSGYRVSAQPATVGELALKESLVVTELRAADGGLEDLFLELTAATQRESGGKKATLRVEKVNG